MQTRRGFTLTELMAVVVILATLMVVAIPRFIDLSTEADTSSDLASLAGLQTALHLVFLDHRATNAPPVQWVTTVAQIETMMQTGDLPAGVIQGVTSSGDKLKDRRGNTYTFTPETAGEPARLIQDATPDPSFS